MVALAEYATSPYIPDIERSLWRSSGTMADIFVSYTRADQEIVRRIVALLEDTGLTVWWDTRINAGERWDEVIEREITAARCVVVVWTPQSINRHWVLTEAHHGLDRGILVPILIGVDRPPFAFGLIQSRDLTGWDGTERAPIAIQLIADIRQTLDEGRRTSHDVGRAVGLQKSTHWETELYGLRFDRRDFWRLLETAYANWNSKPEPSRSLRDVVRGAEMPSVLPLADNDKFSDWAQTAENDCDGDAAHLLQFTLQIYVAAQPPMTIKSELMGSASEFDRFDTIRMDLAKFWDRWGRKDQLEEVIRDQNAASILKGHASEIKLLTFLEISRVRWASSDAPGKSGLFRLGRRNQAVSHSGE